MKLGGAHAQGLRGLAGIAEIRRRHATAQLHRVGRVEQHYGDLQEHFSKDRLEGVLQDLKYSSDDERRGKPNPSQIPISGNPRTNLASYKNAIALYRRFLEGGGASVEAGAPVEPAPQMASEPEDLSRRIGLERDMQAALRQAITQLEAGLEITDDGAERSVESGFIDISAKDSSGRTVVIELKAGPAGQRAVAQILSYMGDVAAEEPENEVPGILVASEFDGKARAAARMVPSLILRKYRVNFTFTPAEAEF